MSNGEPKQALKNAVLEWRKKHGVQDSDPLLAVVELWEIYFSHAQLSSPKERLPSFEEFRNTMEQCERLGGELTGRAAEINQELRVVPKIRNDLNRFPTFALIFTAALAMLAGMLLGKFAL